MKRITSSLLALLLALSMLIGMVPAAYAAQADTIESINSTETVDSSEMEDVLDDAEEVAAQVADGETSEPQTLAEMVYAAGEDETITLPSGTYVIPSGVETGKAVPTGLTIVGAGASETTVEIQGITPGESSGTYFFDGQKAVTFKDLTIDFGPATDYDGFVRAGDMTFENVTIKGMGSHWGKGAVKFTKCSFVYPDEGYNEWTYNLWTYSGSSFEFKDCNFSAKLGGGNETNPARGKFVNVYSQATEGTVSVSLDTCKFKTEKEDSTDVTANKPILKIGNGSAWNISMTNIDITEAEAATDETTGSMLYGSSSGEGILRTDSTSVTINGTTDWKNGAKAEPTGVATVGTTTYDTLAAAIAALNDKDYTLKLLNESAWDAATPVYWEAGTKSDYAATLTDALTAAYMANAGDIEIVCRPGADVGTMTHGHVADNITIYGNNAYISGGECDLEVDTFMFSRSTGAQDTTNGVYLDKDIVINAYELDNLGVWGERHTGYTVSVNLTDCDGKAIEGKENVQRVYISGTSGVNNITLTGCDFMTNNTSVYSNADGAISIKGCSFTGSTIPVNFNHKAGGSQTLNVEGCSFTSCGDNGDWKQFAAPVRFVNSGSGTQSATVDTCTFAGTVGSNGDILIGDGRTGQESNNVSLTVTNTTATVKAQKPGYYNNGTVADATKGKEKPVTSGETLNTSVEEMLPTALTAYVTVNGGTEQYATLDEAIAAAEPENGVITYTVTGKVNANGESWIQVAKAGLTGLTEVKFVGADANAEICITNSTAVLADQSYDIDVSFKDLTLSHPNGAWVGDLGHATNYFTTVLRNTDAANNTVSYTNCTFPNGACNNQYGKTVYANCKFTNATSGKYNLWNYGGNTEIKNSTFTGTRGIKTYNEGTLAVAPTVKIEGTTFNGLTEKAAVVASKATDITFDNVTTMDCEKGTFEKDIENSGETTTITANGSGISGSFTITAEKGEEAAKDEFNISAGTFNSEVSSDYCADGFEVKANENGTYGVVGSTQTTKGTRENPYTLDDLSNMTRAEYIAAQERLGGTMYVTVGDYSYETNGTLGNGERNDTPGQIPDHSKLNAYGENGYLGEKNDGANGKNIVFVGGNITSGVTGYKSIDNIGTSLLLAVPAYTNVTFKGTEFKNVMSFNYQLYTSPWSQLGKLEFDGCTFNGIIVGAIAAQTLTFNKCTFTDYTNTVSANSSNPTWIRPAYGNWTKGDNEGQGSDFKSLTAINFTGNTVTSTRPVKFERIAQWEMPTTVTVTGNSFDIRDTGEKKNVGLYFGATAKFNLIAQDNTKSDNTAALYTAAYKAPNEKDYVGLPAGSTVTNVAGEKVELDALEWKSDKKLTLATSTEVAELSTTDSKNNPVTVRFATLAAAIAAAKDGDTVTLLSDIELTSAQKISKKLTLDLNGKTLDSTAYRTIQLNSGANLTVQDSVGTGKIANSYNGSSYPSTVYLNGKDTVFTLVSGTIESDPYKTSLQSVAINSLKDKACTVNIQGGSVVVPAAAKEGRAIVASTNSMTLNISDGKIAGGLHGIDAYSGSTVNITGGKVTATYVDTGVIKEAYGMRIIGTANVTINGGEIQGIKMDDDGYKLDVPNVTLVSGKVNGSFYSITKGTIVFTVDPTATITFENDTVKNFLPSTVELVRNEDGTYGVTKKVTNVAEVNGNKYETLQAAIDVAPRNGTVKLLADTHENVTISTPYVTLDLNGFTLNGSTGERKPALTVTARVTVKDSSEAQTGIIMREDTAENSGVSSHYVIDVQGSGWLTFESGKVTNGSGNVEGKGASLVRVGDDSVAKYPGLNIKGGTFTQDNFIVIKVDRGDLFLNGGTLNSANSYAIEDWHRATIKGGTVNGAVAAWTYSGGLNSDLTISGGTINGDVTSVNYGNAEGRTAKVSITGGRVTGKLDTRSYDPATNELTSIDDAAKATIEVTGGTFNNDPTKYVVENSKVTNNADGTFGVEKAYLAKIGDKSYYTMDEAFHAVTEGQTIVLLRDYTTASSQNSGSKSFTFDLNGHTWTYTSTDVNSAAFEINYPDVTLTVKNGNVVTNSMLGLIPSAMGGTITYDNAGLVFDTVTATANGHSGIETNGNNTNDSVTLRNSTLNAPNGFGIYFPSSGTLTIENSTINAKTMGVQVCAGSLSINEGSAITVSDGPVDKTENDGAIQDGAAISIVNRTGYKGLGTITVTGGTFTAKSGNAAIKAYNYADKTESSFTESDKVEVSGGTFSAEVPADLCAVGYEPTEKDPSTGMYTVQKVSGNAYYVDDSDKPVYGDFAALVASTNTATKGKTITLLKNVKIEDNLVLFGNRTVDLNGNVLEITEIFIGLYGKVIDSSDGNGLLKIAADNVTLQSDNGLLPIYDSAKGGYRLFNVQMKGMTEGKGNGVVVKLMPSFTNKDAYKLMKVGSTNNITFAVTISWMSENGPASQEFTFDQSLVNRVAESWMNGKYGYFIITLTGLDSDVVGSIKDIKAQGSIKSGTGARIDSIYYDIPQN